MIAFFTRVLGTLAVLLLLASAALALLAGTSTGTRWLLQAAVDSSDGMLEVEGADGSLLGGLSLVGLRIDTGTVRVDLEQAELRLHWPDLLRGRLQFEAPAADLLRLTLEPDPEAAPGDGSRVELPVDIGVRSLHLGRLELISGEAAPVVLGDIAVGGRFAGGIVEVDALSLHAYGVEAAATGRFDTGRPFPLDAELKWGMPDAGVSGEGSAGGSLESLELAMQVRPGGETGGEVNVTGTLAVLDGAHASVLAEWSRVERDVPGIGRLRSDDGRLEFDGGPDAWRATLRARTWLPMGSRPPALLRAQARGDADGLVMESLRADTLGGSLAGRGTLDFDGPAGAFEFAGGNLDPGPLQPHLAGQVDLEGRVTFAGAEFDLHLARLEGELAGRPWRASGRLSREDGALLAQDIDVRAGPNRLRAQGRRAEQLDARFSVDAPALEVLWPGLAGALEGEGTLGGTLERPSGTLRLAGSEIIFAGTAARRLRLVGSLASGDRVDIELDVAGLIAADTALGSLGFNAEGRLADFGTRLELAGGRVEARLEGQGGFEGGFGGLPAGAFTHTLGSGLVSIAGFDPWFLSEPATIRHAAGALSLGAHCWSSDEARVCFGDWRLAGELAEAALRLENFPLATLAALAGDALELDGTLDGQLELTRRDRDIDGRLRLATTDAAMLFRTPEGDELRNRIERLELSLDAGGGSARGGLRLRDEYGLVLDGDGVVTDPLGDTPQVAVTIDGGIPDLGRLSPLIEQFMDIGDLAGAVALSATLDGPLRAPGIRGNLTLDDGALAVPVAGILVQDVALRIEGRPDGRADVSGRARSGEGEVELEGTLRWAGSLLPDGEISLRGRQFEVARLPEGTVLVSPELDLTLVEGLLNIAGRVEVPRAEIGLQELGNGGVQVSPDVVVHGREREEEAARNAFFVIRRIQVVLGEAVTFSGFGLTASLGGQLVLAQPSPGADIHGDGVIRITEGRFRTLGQQLDIERGAIIFAGDLGDPALDVRAVREVNYEGRNVKAGLILTGTASSIQSRVYSEPAMGEMDALSYLTTGRPLSAAGSGDRLSVTNAAVTLGLRGALPVAQRLGSALSVDEVGITGGDTLDDTAVVVGERIGSDLFLRYSYGIFNRAGTIKATYRLNRRVSIEASSGEEQALDLLYSVTW